MSNPTVFTKHEALNDIAVLRDQHAVITVSGIDAEKYLQGQLTNDIGNLTSNKTILAAQCNFKGKMWAIFTVIPFQQGYYLITSTSSLEETLRELKKFAVFSQVSIEHNLDLSFISGHGDKITAINAGLAIPQSHTESIQQGNNNSVSWRCETTQLTHIITQKSDINDLISESTGDGTLVNVLEVEAGQPMIYGQTNDSFIPQMMNLQAIDGISFKKGCYTGQEVVARAKFLGKNKRAMYLLQAEHSQNIDIGLTLELAVGDNWRRIGTVVRSAQHGGKLSVLAVLPNDTESDHQFRLKENHQLSFSMASLPYTLD